jgi:hypothetical protein
MKKIFLKSILLLTLIFAVSCTDNDNENPLEGLTSFTWWVSPPIIDFNIPDKTIKQNKYLAFKDLSQGYVSHEWRITEGTKFITTNFSETDTIYSNNIIPNAGLISDKSLIGVYFPEIGTFKITLKNVYKESVIGATKVSNQWVAEQVFNITVN